MIKDEIQDKALAALLPHYRCGAGVSMGVGKTLIGLRHMAHNYTDYARFLVAAPTTKIIKTWSEEAIKHGLEYLLPHITFTTYLSLPKQDIDYDVAYLDECHSLKESHDAWLSLYHNKILGLTGTPPKHQNSEKGLMVAKYCPIVFKYITDKAISDRILNDYRIVIHKLPLDTAKTMLIKKGEKSWYASEFSTYMYWTGRIESSSTKKEQSIMRVMRMKDMMIFPSKERLAKQLLDSAKDKCILFCNTQNQADTLCTHSCHSDNPLSDENLDKFKDGTINKLTAVQQLSEGVNIKNLKEAIIMHSFSGSSPKSQQKIGRCLRLTVGQIATIHILCYENTIDEYWVSSVLEDFDKSKITYV